MQHMNPEHDDFQKDMNPLCFCRGSCSNNIFLSYLFFGGVEVDVLKLG